MSKSILSVFNEDQIARLKKLGGDLLVVDAADEFGLILRKSGKRYEYIIKKERGMDPDLLALAVEDMVRTAVRQWRS